MLTTANCRFVIVREDVLQEFGQSSQYKESVENAELLSFQLENHELTYVGHSLGGGEAGANLLATGTGKPTLRHAITFNAAGVSSATITNLGLDIKNKINIINYCTYNDILTGAENNTPISKALGTTIRLPMKTPMSPLESHKLDSFPE